LIYLEPLSGFEPETPSLPWKCSTTELQRHNATNSTNLLNSVQSYLTGVVTKGLF
jgi:hypothetical protein